MRPHGGRWQVWTAGLALALGVLAGSGAGLGVLRGERVRAPYRGPRPTAAPAPVPAVTTTSPETRPAAPRPVVPVKTRPAALAARPAFPADLTSGCHRQLSARRSIVCMATTSDGRGYWLVSAAGGVFAFGDARYYGGESGHRLAAPVVGMAPTPDGAGYWLVTADGGVFAFGDAPFFGSLAGRALDAPVVGISPTADGKGYWLVASDGGVFAFGDASYDGSAAGLRLSAPVVGMTVTPSGSGYWLVSATGGVFAFGDAPFLGGMAGDRLRSPVVGLARTPNGEGYWLVAADGGVFTYGTAPYYGSMGGRGLVAPMVGMTVTPSGSGYWLVAADGGVFTYGTAAYEGSSWSTSAGPTIMASIRSGGGPRVAIFYYPWYASPPLSPVWRHWNEGGHNPPYDIGSNFYPVRGAYDSSDPGVVDGQMAEISSTGINEIVVSWWGRSSFEDEQLPLVAQAAADHGLTLAIHIEPYPGRSASSVAADVAYLRSTYGVTQFFVYDTQDISAAAWSGVTRSLSGVTLWATGYSGAMFSGAFEAWAASAGFSGVYTYDGLDFAGSELPGVCAAAHRDGLLCSPSVAPGFDAERATGNTGVRSRDDGATYDSMWEGALAASPDLISITSYNEWHEGTQIEPAQPYCIPGSTYCYRDYSGAYGLTGVAAESAYLDRTTYWIQRLRS